MMKVISSSGMQFNGYPLTGTFAKLGYDELQKWYDS